jgi:ABC-type glycerol-3-phosphate transport system substrate-binding protein
MKKIFILFFTLILLLSGCGGSGSTSNDNTIETKRITSNTELKKYWDKLDTALEKDQYETTSAYNQRISEFIDSENN